MNIPPPFERRKNPARKRKIAFDVTYWVIWNDALKHFDVCRAGERTGVCARDKATTIGLAIRSAQEEDRSLKIEVKSIQDGKTIVEWSR